MRRLQASLAFVARRFKRNADGTAAIEFALLLPVFLVLYVAVIEFSHAFMVQRRAEHTASMMADIVAQSNSVTTAQLADYFAIGGMIMTPYSATPLKGRVSSIVLKTNNQAQVEWSYAQGAGMTRLTTNSVVTIPANLLKTQGESLILAETVYAYDSPFDIKILGFDDYLSGITTFKREFYLRPREVATVSCTNCPK